MRTFTRPLIALALPITLVLAACSSSGGATTAPSAAAPTVAPSVAPASQVPASEAPASEAPPASAATGGTSIALVTSALGSILVDAAGKTVYGFKADAAGTSTCYDECAANWPPLLATDAASAGTGLDAALLTTIDRTDGTKQLKYGDWPLYYFAADAAAGDTNGQGKGDVWYVVGADGKLIE